MIRKIEEIPVTKDSYPFGSAERYCNLSDKGYKEKEYYMHGTANVYRSIDEQGNVEVMTKDAPYVNRFVVRAPKDREKFSGNVVVEIINATAFFDLERMWILGYREFVRNGDIYIGITSKPNTIPKLLEFDQKRYEKMSWANPTPEKKFSFSTEEYMKQPGKPHDIDINYETGLFWDMLTDLAWLIRSEDEMNPICDYKSKRIFLTGWSQSSCYLFRYVNSFAYRPEVERGKAVFDGYLAAGVVRSFPTPVSQYESAENYKINLCRINKAKQPVIAMQTESENGAFDGWLVRQEDSDDPELLYRIYDITGASHDTVYSCVDYYKKDPDMEKIGILPVYCGKHEEGNDYPSYLLVAAAYRNLYRWVETGVGPASCERIALDGKGKNVKDAFRNSIGGLRTCLLDYPTGIYDSISKIEVGKNALYPESDEDRLFGHQEAFPKEMVQYLYGSLEHYKELVTKDTMKQVRRGFICPEDADELIGIAMDLARKRGLN